MSASPMARATTVGQDIPRRVVINNEDDMPDDYSTTPGQTTNIKQIYHVLYLCVFIHFQKKNDFLLLKEINYLEFSKCANIERCTQLG